MIRVLVAHDTCLLRSALAALLGREADFEVTDTAWPRLAESARDLRPDVCVVDADCTGWRQHVGGSGGPLGVAPGRPGRPATGAGSRRSADAGRARPGDAGPGRGVARPTAGSAAAALGLATTSATAVGGPARPRCALVVLTGAGRPGNLRRAHEAHALGFVNKDRSADRLPTAVRQAAQGKRFVDESLAVEFLQAAEMPLTRRELSVLSLSAEGAPVTEIARRLHLSDGTVRNYLAAITRKTGARNRVDAIRISQVAGWV
ncbi:two-component system, NarL family, response regulator DesR [Actinacidiphila yanglinensis]|uniref:Two-component system, NarL family, response regulator DesR n=1 Tax=Actinacidiphila yanglinensis TaxID=310779 RepID=A0A1H5SJ37_9ACTN|nr:response regulator transcription factor [Actinacidiphila yanglinensis]SEF50626.1 two-component system, NarL family, response regulator DesR [Actinacidiphila yanglinensis]